MILINKMYRVIKTLANCRLVCDLDNDILLIDGTYDDVFMKLVKICYLNGYL